MNTDTPPPSPAGYGPAFKGDGQTHDDKGTWLCFSLDYATWGKPFDSAIADSRNWYCKPLIEKAQVKGEPEWPKYLQDKSGQVYRLSHKEKGHLVTDVWNGFDWVIRFCCKPESDLLASGYTSIPASRAAELTGEIPWPVGKEAMQTGACRAPLPVARDTGEVCECGHKRNTHFDDKPCCSVWECNCQAFRKRGDEKCDITAQSEAPVSSPAPGETTKPVSEGAKCPPTPCCGYEATKERGYPVFWNHFNGVVQCHNCGHVYAPELPAPTWHSLDDYPLKDREAFHLLFEDGITIVMYPQGVTNSNDFLVRTKGKGYLIHPAVPPYAIPEPPVKGEKPMTVKEWTFKQIEDHVSYPAAYLGFAHDLAVAIKKGEVAL